MVVKEAVNTEAQAIMKPSILNIFFQRFQQQFENKLLFFYLVLVFF